MSEADGRVATGERQMTRSKMYMVLATCVAVAGVGYGAYAQTGAGTPPSMIPYHGYLEDAAGPIDGTRNLTFFITSAAGGNLASALWQETRDVSFSNGYFSVALGASTPIPASTFNQATRFLRVQIDGNQLNGAQQLLATPYSITAQVANTFSVNTLAVAGAATAASVTTTGVMTSGDDILVGGGVRVGNHPTITNPATGDIAVAGDVRVNDDIFVNSDLNVTGAINWTPGVTTTAVRDCFYTNGNPQSSTCQAMGGDLDIGSAGDRVCFLAEVRLKQDSASDWGICNVYTSGGRWFLQSTATGGDADSRCRASCIVF